MEKEKEKRWRPSVTEYREMKKQVDDALSSLQVARLEILSGKEDLEKMKAEVKALTSSNRLMEKELTLQRGFNEELQKENERLRFEAQMLRERGFWARLLNRN